MFKLNMNEVIQMMVDKELNRRCNSVYDRETGIRTVPGVLIKDISLRCSDYDTHQEIVKMFSMLFCGNTSVFWFDHKIHTKDFVRSAYESDCSKWVNSSNHDSCWRSDGFSFLSDVYFEMCRTVNPDIAPVHVNKSASIGFALSWPVEHVTLGIVNSTTHDYRYCLKNISRITEDN